MREEIHKGIKDTWAAALGLIPLGLAFGLLMVQSGFSWWWAPIFSTIIYAGSMEFLAISMVTGGVSVFSSLLTGFMVNFRHIFYGLTFPRARISSPVGKVYSTYALTDESYAIVSALPTEERLSGPRILSIQIFCQILWVGCGFIGALTGQVIPSSVEGMEFALVALFVVLAMDSFRNNQDLSLPLSAAALGILAAFITPGQLLMVSLSAYFLLLIIRYLSPRVDDSLTWRLDPLSSTTVKEWK
ncbi:branched-chain amino acid ABC transporter permease [Corynebacterium macginleyi]|uniref:AzlC family ABC transporter permease n=1 Tax=Corynebacterium macginleyi TaxID=38290 RepID=A0A3M0FZK4_9CORY|nr:AzlC family ABC transporter permease [Corynebacterium macginleyi]MBK4139543.1 branched-chain amino acid ABC transporter permease [Corynebacterium macginleyi]MBK4144142.1 branched-chain amino acid ABC transporter permease [Corynebacterium macginleyi]MBK4146806.1 branched-chain amino acid ABC transporter permease [Corynebacterium macginleyi]MBK4149569.1 branched-chain amino acid ABC transporter permease [Corynebacterium macginleyi]MBK4153128.1 branched-chain amino acid ABC transporter permeas